MTENKRTDFQKEHDYKYISNLYLKGHTLAVITEKINMRYDRQKAGFNLSLVQIHYDLQTIIKRWQESGINDIDSIKAIELEKLNNLESTAWNSFNLSIGKTLKTTTQLIIDGKNKMPIVDDKGKYKEFVKRETEHKAGDPRFLEIIHKCIISRLKVFGLYEPDEKDTGKKVTRVIYKVPDNRRRRDIS